MYSRRIQHEINILRSQLKHQSLEQIDYRQEFSSYPLNDFHPIRRTGSVETTNKNSYFEHELQALLNRKTQLEYRIRQLQQSREELTSQLDYLERSFSPYDRSNISHSKNIPFRSYSTPATPVHHRMTDYCKINH
jgi:chromosome segregation ATPase